MKLQYPELHFLLYGIMKILKVEVEMYGTKWYSLSHYSTYEYF